MAHQDGEGARSEWQRSNPIMPTSRERDLKIKHFYLGTSLRIMEKRRNPFVKNFSFFFLSAYKKGGMPDPSLVCVVTQQAAQRTAYMAC